MRRKRHPNAPKYAEFIERNKPLLEFLAAAAGLSLIIIQTLMPVVLWAAGFK